MGELWRRTFYSRIKHSLGLDERADVESRDLLYELLLGDSDRTSLEKVRSRIDQRDAVVFGAGPSLESDLRGLKDYLEKVHPVIIAADGAADALREYGRIPDLIVSDLDSCSVNILKQTLQDGFVFAHAHGDNMDLIKTIIPQIKSRNLIGTTQVESRDLIRNFGGFTDGDRACYIAASFGPSKIILAGMDFGDKEGSYSINRYSSTQNPKRPQKLGWGVISLEFLIRNSPALPFRNVTKLGVEIRGAPRLEYEALTSVE
jgi:2-amino-4-hydroxy-6-hydroxymethyldihydropteridine diphosphokinase